MKLKLEAIRKLSEKWIHDETIVELCDMKYVIAANPLFGMIIFENGEWRPMKIAIE